MKVRQLLEAKVQYDFSPFTKVWEGMAFHDLVEKFKKHYDEDHPNSLLGSLLERAKQKHGTSAPEKILNFVKPLLKASDEIQHQQTVEDRYHVHDLVGDISSLLTEIVRRLLEVKPFPPAELLSAVNLSDLMKEIHPKYRTNLTLAFGRSRRTPDQEKFDEENDVFVFIGRPKFVETSDGNYRKTLEIERLVKVDRFKGEDHQMIGMMKVRASAQGGDSEVYQVSLPKDAFSEKDLDNPPSWLVELINKHKIKVT